MPFIADLHIHSPYSRATSPKGNLPGLYAWARAKGIQVIGSGDFTHPAWQAHLREHLEPAEPGLFRLKDERVPPAVEGVAPGTVRFMLTSEISSIYKKNGKVRKIHNILFAPDFAAMSRISVALAAIGNIEADGRPILGLDARDLLEINLEKNPDGFLVPAHIWTPWFSLFGANSGFDSIEECFGDLTPHVFALETGLSSDPEMNRLISALDRYTLISNSDSHSPHKLGREANLFSCAPDFFAMREALKNPSLGFQGTVEFYPEEGKYHLDGHRHCKISLSPAETRHYKGLCPVCGKPITVGVLHRVMELADREQPFFPANAPAVHSLVPLPELLGELLDAGPDTKGVQAAYAEILRRFGSEFELLLHTPVDDIRARHSEALAESVRRVRAGEVIRQGGFDGEYGVIKVFAPGEKKQFIGQDGLFGVVKAKKTGRKPRNIKILPESPPPPASSVQAGRLPDPDQAAAIAHRNGHLLVSAGPGSGKTFTLIARLVRLLNEDNLPADKIVAITFTRRAAQEIRERLASAAGERASQVFTGTFHAFALHWLRRKNPELAVIGEETREILLKNLFPDLPASERQRLSEQDLAFSERYQTALREQNAIDLEAVIPFFVENLAQDPAWRDELAQAVGWLCVDEFQDLNAAQYRLVSILAEQAQVFAIGDPNQAIYGFRGADWRYFGRFAEECGATTLALRRNYRSQARIVAAAEAVIRLNRPSPPAPLPEGEGSKSPSLAGALVAEEDTLEGNEWNKSPSPTGRGVGVRVIGEPLAYFRAADPAAEAAWVAGQIENLLGGTSHRNLRETAESYGFGDVAILYRFNQQAEALRAALEARGLPAQQIGATPFFMQLPLRAVYHWLRCAADPGAAEHLPLLAGLRGIGAASRRKLEQGLPLQCADFLAAANALDLPRQAGKRLAELAQALGSFREQAVAQGLAVALPEALAFLEIPPGPESARLLALAGVFGGDLPAFAAHLENHAQATVYDPRAQAVSLMSLHAAKGLEFPVVFLTGLESGLLPCDLPGLATPEDEERRLFYVGMTRAKDRLFLSACAERTLFGATRRAAPSPFLAGIPADVLREIQPAAPRPGGLKNKQISLF